MTLPPSENCLALSMSVTPPLPCVILTAVTMTSIETEQKNDLTDGCDEISEFAGHASSNPSGIQTYREGGRRPSSLLAAFCLLSNELTNNYPTYYSYPIIIIQYFLFSLFPFFVFCFFFLFFFFLKKKASLS